jgi:hypothetical protein
MARLIQGGIYDDIIDTSMAAFILQLIVQHGDPAKVRINNLQALWIRIRGSVRIGRFRIRKSLSDYESVVDPRRLQK